MYLRIKSSNIHVAIFCFGNQFVLNFQAFSQLKQCDFPYSQSKIATFFKYVDSADSYLCSWFDWLVMFSNMSEF